VRCALDRTIPPALQDRFISEADTAFPGNPTHVVELVSARSPFLSMPGPVADIVAALGVTEPAS